MPSVEPSVKMARADDSPKSDVDVLIIGAGPCGLTAAYWMAQYGINARIIDKRGTKVFNGQADGLRAHTMELFDSMGIEQKVSQEAKACHAFRSWGPDGSGGIVRTGIMPFTEEAYAKSRFFVSCLNQGRIERHLLDAIKDAKPDLQVERGVIAESMTYDEALEGCHDAYPITVTLRTLSEEEANPSPVHGASSSARDGLFRSNLAPDDWEDLINKSKAKAGHVETVRCRYVIGADGAHSWTRKQLGYRLEGNSSEQVWGVMDVVPISNFPDMRHSATIRNGASGTILLVQRERGLMRLYIPLADTESAAAKETRTSITLDMLRAKVQKIFHPYTFDFKICDWWSAYQVGQRAANALSAPHQRIHIAGDAAHTHSPKVGAGMNISIQDGYNIGWKVASVAAGLSPASILPTYEAERQPVAQKLAAFDREWSALFKPGTYSTPEDFKCKTDEWEDFSQGFVLGYPASVAVAKGGKAEIAQKLVAGERFWPAKLVNHADGGAAWSTGVMKSDGRWRVVILPGDVGKEEQMARVRRLCDALEATKGGVLAKFTPKDKKKDAVVDVMTVHSADRAKVSIFDFPELLRPLDEERGVDYDKIWIDEYSPIGKDLPGNAYETWGLDMLRGALLVMRPDQYIGWIGDLEDVKELDRYLAGVLNTQAATAIE